MFAVSVSLLRSCISSFWRKQPIYVGGKCQFVEDLCQLLVKKVANLMWVVSVSLLRIGLLTLVSAASWEIVRVPWCGDLGRVARQRPSQFTAKVSESPLVSCNSAQMLWRPRLADNFCRATHLLGIVTVSILSATVTSWHPTGVSLVEGRSRTLSCKPENPLFFPLP